MRSLAHVEKIEWIKPIEGKDRIEFAGLLGWSCIIQKGEFQVGDLAVYIEIDSVLAEKPEFEFLRKRCFVDNGVVRGFRIRTMRMSSVLSQGLLLPLSILPPGNYNAGQDVTNELGIVLYKSKEERDAEQRAHRQDVAGKKGWWFRIKRLLKLKTSHQWPSWVIKTDEERLQNIPHILADSGDWFITCKLEGQSGSFSKKNNKYYVCSRTQVKKVVGGNFWEKLLAFLDNFILGTKYEGNSNWTVISDKYNLEKIPNDYTVQGEIIGNGIQGNIYHINGLDFYVFNVEYQGKCLSLDAMLDFCDTYGLKFVPVLEKSIKLSTRTFNEWLDYADGESVLYPTLREGVVFRKHTADGSKVSFKIRSNKYLLKHGE